MTTAGQIPPSGDRRDRGNTSTHPPWISWAAAIPVAITMILSLASLGGLYQKWLEPIGLHIWMESVFTNSFSSFDLYADDPTRYKVMFSWIVVVASTSGFVVSLAFSWRIYKHVANHPQMYLALAGLFLVMLALLLLPHHGPRNVEIGLSRSTRRLFYSGIYSFGFWGLGLSGSAFFAGSALFSGIILTIRQLFGYRDIDNESQ